MPKPRKLLIAVESTPYYHCVARCVRRAFLCGIDSVTGNNYEHRRAWLEDRLLELPNVFAIDIAAYAIMSNHYHVILHINTERAKNWTDYEVVERWHQLFNGTVLSQKYLKDEGKLSKVEALVFQETIDKWRLRLQDISWFMRILNEYIAREANKEDNVTGRFWEGRFKSQALLDEQALVTCMAYVDLNPVRAGITKTPEASDYTSIQERIQKVMQDSHCDLLPFTNKAKASEQYKSIPFELNEYIALVDWSGRAILYNKRGSIPLDVPPILHRLGIDKNDWVNHIHYFERQFPTVAGNIDMLKSLAEATSRKWIKGMGCAFLPMLN